MSEKCPHVGCNGSSHKHAIFRHLSGGLLLAGAILAGCSSNKSTVAITEGRAYAKQLMDASGANAVTVALMDGSDVIWAEAFGVADKSTSRAPTTNTLFGIGSTSKMFATTAVMKLVDQGKISLDEPVTTYLPQFVMLSPEYAQITVRMLLNHSSGFPGTDYRGAVTTSARTDYADQVVQTLAVSRLKTTPGFMSVYCNDGFTLIEKVIEAVSGKSYAQFVSDEIFTPLGMTLSRYPLEPFPAGSYAKGYINDVEYPQEYVDAYGSGGVYSTPSELMKFATVFLGTSDAGKKILSRNAVSTMTVDQISNSFVVTDDDAFRYGLGWDTVQEPGLGAVGLTAWAKGGDSDIYGSEFIVVPQLNLAVAVIGVSGFGSGNATKLAEKILLGALVDKGILKSIPDVLDPSDLPLATVPDDIADYAGYYAFNAGVFKIALTSDNALEFSIFKGDSWAVTSTVKYRTDHWFHADSAPGTGTSFVVADGRRYMVSDKLGGMGHYKSKTAELQQIQSVGTTTAAWAARIGKTWLVANEFADASSWWNGATGPRLSLYAEPGLDGVVMAGRWTSNSAPATQVLNASADDSTATMILVIPLMNGRDMNDLNVESYGAEEWLRMGSYRFRPLETVPDVTVSPTEVTIGEDGFNEWVHLPATGSAITISAPSSGRWAVYDSQWALVSTGLGSTTSAVTFPASGYVIVIGEPADSFTISM